LSSTGFRGKLDSMMIRIAALLLLLAPSLLAAERPNFLIILADDLGFSDIGC
jgi:hypothetical protein